MKKLTRDAKLLIFTFIFILFVAGGLVFVLFLNPGEEGKDNKSTEDKYSLVLVSQDQNIMSTYIDSISTEKGNESYTDCKVEIKKGTKIGEYTLSQDQSFSKYIQLTGPDGKEIISKKSKQVVSHYAYTMLLTGDIAEKTNLDTNEKSYEVVNARVTYNQIPLVLLANENSVCLANKSKQKEKIVNYQEFIEALKSPKQRGKMISW